MTYPPSHVTALSCPCWVIFHVAVVELIVQCVCAALVILHMMHVLTAQMFPFWCGLFPNTFFSTSFISLKFFCFLLTNVCLLTALISFVFKNIFPPSCISHYSVLPTFLVTAFFVLIQVTDCLASRTPVFFPKMFQHDRKNSSQHCPSSSFVSKFL